MTQRALFQLAFNSICKTMRLTSEDVRKNIGSRALQPVGAARLSAWLSQKEDEYRIVLYQSDATLTPWTLRCLRQADCVLMVGYGDEAPDFNDIGKFLLGTADKLRGRKDLVLLHKLSGPNVLTTRTWIDAHPWISLHHHIACPDRMFHTRLPRLSQSGLRPRAATMDFPHTADKHSDFSRLARILTGTAVGLVLGGGGARGFSHVGMIESLLEEGIPIDMIGGVSMGAFVSALWALYRDLPEVRRRCKIWAQSMGNPWNVFREITYPYMALFSGKLYNQFVRAGVGDVQIEQLWIPYFCASCDITDVALRVHTRGDLWRYARASMTVVGYFPPICDPEDGHLLVDGGYMVTKMSPLPHHHR
ncbi:hypothetical protein RvY_13742 [Ramazzottius varieornatus]|uniref:PNPLA domain-containing protein n=1 Tax=Ramazzottius varieornatus TaxID=947166 RepID=A0A1D1VU59_RAMVA|nr:hypothetical protein RvY_13742 [Ramazzottius varieornatus]